MANDSEVNIGTKVDESGLDKGLKSVKNKVNNAAKDMNKGAKATNALKTAFNETGGAASSFASKMGSVASSGGAVAAGITAAILAAKKYIETLKQANEAYKVQEKAENALSKAAENNPYLNSESVQHLKEYASELQNISNLGDEGTIDVMAQLAAAGRSESEIIKLVGAAADYAAAKHISLESAVQNLNKSYGGLAGELGELFPEVKALTAEQLKNGEAVDIIAAKYKGFAQEAADSSTQAKNAFGDFMESLGRFANPTFEALSQKAKSFWESMTEKMNSFNKLLEKARKEWAIGGDNKWAKDYINDVVNYSKTAKDKTALYDANIEQLNDYDLDSVKIYLEQLELKKKLGKEQAEILKLVRKELQIREAHQQFDSDYSKYAEKYRNYSKETLQTKIKEKETLNQIDAEWRAITDELEKRAEAEKKAQEEATKAAQKGADDYAKASNQKLQDSLKALEVEAKARGEAVSAQDKYNVYLQSYIDLMTKTEGLIKEGYPVEQKRLEQLKEAKKAVEEAADAEKKLAAAIELTRAATEALNSASRHLTPAAELEAEIKQLEEIKTKIEAMSDAEIAAAQKGQEAQLTKSEILAGLNEAEKQATLAKVEAITATEKTWWDKCADQQQQMLELKQKIDESEVLSEEEKVNALKAIDESYSQSRKQQFAELATEIKGYTDQAVQIVQQAAQLQLDVVKNQATAEQAELEIKYRKGEIGEEEYNKKVAESKKKAAKEQYKIQMWQWGASILQATANIAQGISMAIAQGGVAGLITGALVGAAGAVQIASIIASKPTPPSFSTGGIIQGSSTHGDNIAANLNSREMVMNMSQQKALWDFINGGSNGGAGGTNIVINNSASNLVRAQPQITKDKIELLIDARVNDSLKNGRYNTSLNMAQQGMSGDFYGI